MNLVDATNGQQPLQIIESIHRQPDAVIAFNRKLQQPKIDKKGKDKFFESIGSFKMSNLPCHWSQLAPWLKTDSYMTINSYAVIPKYQLPTGFNGVLRKERFLKYLNAAYVDLDVGRPESSEPEQRISAVEALDQARRIVSNGDLPPYSLFALSGRGLYLIWRLVDEIDNQLISLKASRYNLAFYKIINKAINERLSHLASDASAHDGARVLRVPGSIHSKSAQITEYHIQRVSGEIPQYTLGGLSRFFNLDPQRASFSKDERMEKTSALPVTKKRVYCPACNESTRYFQNCRASGWI